jgi:hypothetical protein
MTVRVAGGGGPDAEIVVGRGLLEGLSYSGLSRGDVRYRARGRGLDDQVQGC